ADGYGAAHRHPVRKLPVRLMRRVRGEQHGQVLPIFAIMAVAVLGVVALGVDFGVIANEHRSLQAYADDAAIAGAQQLSPLAVVSGGSALTSAQQAARRQAFVVLRDN